uniref:F-box domain-containing protein n=1 Tax=Steinernema glaseri TaxID=37863 RepID=A0A1I8ATE9_9BILA
MDALPVELVGPIVKLINPESLANLKKILHPDTPWSLSVDHTQASRFSLSVYVKYIRGSDRMQLYISKRFFNTPNWIAWTPQDDDCSKIETFFVTVKHTEPGMQYFNPQLQMRRAVCYSRVKEALNLMNSSRKLNITVKEQLDQYPGGLLDLLPRKRDSLQVILDTVKSPILPPFDIPIRLHLWPFVGRFRADKLKRLRGRDCLRWLLDYWNTYYPEQWDWDILIPMVDADIWEKELQDFTYKSHRNYYYDMKRWNGKQWYLDIWFLPREQAVKVKTRNDGVKEAVKVNATQEQNIESVLFFGAFVAISILLIWLRGMNYV